MTDEQPGPTTNDGFRPRRKRPKGWYAKALKSGEIADPDNPQPEPIYGEDAQVVSVPMADVSATVKED